MRTRLPRTLRPALVAGALLATALGATVPAASATASSSSEAAPAAARTATSKARLDLVIHRGGADGSVVAQVVLACLPTGGTHPRRVSACATVQRAGADFAAITPEYGACPTTEEPVTVTADGFWESKPVSFRKAFPNRCLAERATGGVFRF